MAFWLLMMSVLFYKQQRECHGQCFQTRDTGCQERCQEKGLCPMAGGDQ